jgi:hypothetical protein
VRGSRSTGKGSGCTRIRTVNSERAPARKFVKRRSRVPLGIESASQRWPPLKVRVGVSRYVQK